MHAEREKDGGKKGGEGERALERERTFPR